MSARKLAARCDCCGCALMSDDLEPGRHWSLLNYYGVSGHFCDTCYRSKISHDGFGKPRHPTAFLNFMRQHQN